MPEQPLTPPFRRRRRDDKATNRNSFVRSCDILTEIVLCFMIVFSPWAFGTTQPWSIWTMNVCGFFLGALLLATKISRPPISGDQAASPLHLDWSSRGHYFTLGLIVFTFFILAYCLVSALNARARYIAAQQFFEYFENYIHWLPHSYDQDRTMASFWNYLALALTFWAAYNWLTNDPVAPTRRGHSALQHAGRDAGAPSISPAMPRLHRLFWLLSINGALLAFQGLLQRVDGGNKLLWIMETRLNREATAQFGPYAYRSNAAQYFNLLWPAMLGFWWWLELRCREIRSFSTRHRLLLPLIVLVAICPLVSLSRAGAAVAVMNAVAVGVIIFFSWRGSRARLVGILGIILMALAGMAYLFNGATLAKRFASSSEDFLVGREATYETARKILADYPIFGTGPGTFEPVFQLYRSSPDQYWPTQLHNDWLETAITFGTVGLTATLLALALIFFQWLVAGSSRTPWSFAAMLWVALVGCLVFAKVDFPFQIYSILFLFLMLCAVLLSVSHVNGRTGKSV